MIPPQPHLHFLPLILPNKQTVSLIQYSSFLHILLILLLFLPYMITDMFLPA
uniref:Uncharacterized protein n=1 Tax=Manihot esculenta TaxID=3983 RepID=A0A2C9UZ38_MANES